MPDFEHPLRSLELHVCKSEVERAYVRGRHDGLSRARKEVAWIVLAVVVAWAIASVDLDPLPGAISFVVLGLAVAFLAWRYTPSSPPRPEYRTVDGRLLAPHPGMSDADLYEFERDLKVPNPTFQRPPE